MTGPVLHTVGRPPESDPRFWVRGPAGLTVAAGELAPLGRLGFDDPAGSIRRARQLAAARLGVPAGAIRVADYLAGYLE